MAFTYEAYHQILAAYGLPLDTRWKTIEEAYIASGGHYGEPITPESVIQACEYITKNKIYNRLAEIINED